MDTGLTANGFNHRRPTHQRTRQQLPVRRARKPEEVAEREVYLPSRQTAFFTGQRYLLNGGMHYL